MEKENIISRYKSGEAVSHIAKSIGYSREGVYKILRQMENFKETSLVLREEGKIENSDGFMQLVPEIRRLKFEKLTVIQIAQELDITTGLVKKALKGFIKDRNNEIFRLYKSGLTQKEIARNFNMAQTNVSNILNRHFKHLL